MGQHGPWPGTNKHAVKPIRKMGLYVWDRASPRKTQPARTSRVGNHYILATHTGTRLKSIVCAAARTCAHPRIPNPLFLGGNPPFLLGNLYKIFFSQKIKK